MKKRIYFLMMVLVSLLILGCDGNFGIKTLYCTYFVINDVPEHSTVIGVPGRIVKQKVYSSDGVLQHNRIPDPVSCELNRRKYEILDLEERIKSLEERL